MISYIIEIATFDLVDTDDIYEDTFQMTVDEESYTESFGELGYETNNIILNMGTVFIIFLINLVAFMCMGLLRLIKRCCCEARFGRWHDKLHDAFIWNGVIRFVLEGYLEFAIICFLNFIHLYTETIGDKISAVLSAFFTFMLTIFPIVIMVVIIKHRKDMTSEEFDKKYGEFYTGLKVKMLGLSSLLFPVFFMLRRIFLVVIMIFAIEYSYF
eukprot:CAMPEP_0176349552 /NCGR_PEP_ID=MMETSP0126-20121128/8747_1 /TAXON_ID=141414 ORGANISM="Strombidinopsis acuminatum, Strain SPMC142" /NCGR_SAMPLE_ID=MMETSP0126 /ASSEMBLY_ACC=CAM_ASM_000229 /LENGTH=212 /DNA_ID=CAMNT_0017698993 /DNA_START=215 /DNA_END=853 /DNA_ORIENTATION=-